MANLSDKRGSYQREPSGSGLGFGRVLPHDLDAEQAVIASCVLEGGRDTVSLCDEYKLSADCFYKPEHQVIYSVIHQIVNKEGIPVDEIILMDRLNNQNELEAVGGHLYIGECCSRIENTAHTIHYVKIVREKFLLRRLIQMTSETLEKCYTQQDSLAVFIEQVEQEIFKISQDRISDSAIPLKDPLQNVAIMIQQIKSGKRSQYGVQTQFSDLDRLTLGLHRTEMIVLAGRPGTGKTSFVMNFVENALLPPPGTEPVPTLVFSLEMGAEQLAMRMLCSNARVDMKKVREGFTSREEDQAIGEATRTLKNLPLYIDDSAGLTVLELRAKARRVHARNPLGLIVVDYLQLVNGTNSQVQREQQVAEVSRGLKALAKELNIPVVVLAQLNRKAEEERREPRASDLRESGSIEQDADVILILHRPRKTSRGHEDEQEEEETYDGSCHMKLLVVKNRNGPTGEIDLTFMNRYTRFQNFISDQALTKRI